jgi:hypothetical protein
MGRDHCEAVPDPSPDPGPPDAYKKSHRECTGVTFAVIGIQSSGTAFGFTPVLYMVPGR